MGPLALSALGLLLGMRHATDADHVVAITTIACRERAPRGALALGALWGLGHTVTVLVVGGAIILFGAVIPPRLGLSLEMAVAVMLIGLGLLNLLRSGPRRSRAAAHAHTPGGARWRAKPIAIGVVHGLAGSAAVALLVLATIQDHLWAVIYLGLFGAGTIAGMMIMTVAMVVPVSWASRRFGGLERVIPKITGLASLAFGLFLAYRLGVVDGLFREIPHWTPR